ncbi:recombinase family protein [Streptomyces sp. NPDC005407]|uniref:recombinase family protein n=1 Tax=Streptomyces sp. NPDC005407 TaxID=3155340 RepID=UPI0033A1565A
MGVGLARKGIDCSQRLGRHRWTVARRPSAPVIRWRASNGWAGESAAIYCRISHVNDDDQTGVERQERICRDVADRLGLIASEDQVFVDNLRSAWQRKRKRPGCGTRFLAEANEGRIRHVFTYHPDRLMRQPRDLEELLQIADDHDITLYGPGPPPCAQSRRTAKPRKAVSSIR